MQAFDIFVPFQYRVLLFCLVQVTLPFFLGKYLVLWNGFSLLASAQHLHLIVKSVKAGDCLCYRLAQFCSLSVTVGALEKKRG